MTSRKRIRKTGRPAPSAARTHPLGTELTIRNAAGQKAGLVGLLRGTGPVTLGAADLERVDTAGLQLLAAVVVALRSAGRDCQWDSPAHVLRDGAAAVGLSGVLGL